jgi:CheY-like chemotaxis protein
MEIPKTRILIIEDNPDDQDILLWQLRKAGLQQHVKMISDGKEAVEYVLRPDTRCEDIIAVFLDLKLPSLDGLRVLEEIRKGDLTRSLPVIVMTSSNKPSDLEKCQQMGVSSYVQKPVTFEVFQKVIADKFHVPTNSSGSVGIVLG